MVICYNSHTQTKTTSKYQFLTTNNYIQVSFHKSVILFKIKMQWNGDKKYWVVDFVYKTITTGWLDKGRDNKNAESER